MDSHSPAPTGNAYDQQISGPIHWFSDWPTSDVPRSGAVVYTIWDREGFFIYVGMSGRSFTGAAEGNGKAGPWGRLNSHANGRRSGDQFCVYVADRLVLPTLHNRIAEIADGSLSLDVATRDYIRLNLGFRWIDLIPGNWTSQSENFPVISPGWEKEMDHEGVQVFGAADCSAPQAGR